MWRHMASACLPKSKWSSVCTVSPPAHGVYFHLQILALEEKLPMTPFCQRCLGALQGPALAADTEAWRIVLGFEALCATYAHVSY